MKNTNSLLRSLALITGVLTIANLASGAIRTWNGSTDQLWSTTGNWTSTKPGASDTALFTNASATGTSGPLGTVNNYVDGGFTTSINNLQYMNTNGFHNTRITNALSIKGTATGSPSTLTSSGNAIAVGSGQADDGKDATVYATIQGDSLNISNRAGFLVIRQWSATAGNHNATLDLSGLNNFTATLGDLYIGFDSGGTYNRPSGVLTLARTNTITLVDAGNDYHLGYGYGANNTAVIYNHLGQVNFFNIDQMRIGGPKCNQGAWLDFTAGLVNPTVKLRGTNGVARQTTWTIGDNSPLSGSGATATKGYADFTRGSVDALVDTIYVGKGGSGAYTGTANGTLTFGAGTTNFSTIDVNTLQIGYSTTNSIGSGIVNVQSNGTLVVNKDANLGMVAAGTAVPVGLLNINGGKVTVAGNVVDGGGTTTLVVTNGGSLDLKPAGDSTAGSIAAKTVIVGAATITNYGTLSTTNLTVRSPATTFTVYPGQSLAPAAAGVAGPLTINGSLTLTNANLKFDLGAAASDQMAVTNVVEFDGTNSLLINPLSDFGAGTYALLTFGTAFVGDPANNVAVGGAMASSRYSFSLDTNTPNTLTLSVTGVGPTNLTWSGDGGGNVWNLNGIANWNVNTEKFFSLDAVTFEDSGSALPAVNLVGSVMPSSVTVSGTKAYTFGGSGKISGFTSLSQQSSGTLTILSTNDFSGLTAIASGSTLQVGNGTTADGALGTGEIQNSGSLIFAPVGSQTFGNLISVNNDLTKLGPGRTILSAANTFNGPVTVIEGTLVAGNATCLGSTSSSAAITNGGALDLNGFGLGDKPLVVSGAGVGGAGAIVNTGAANQEALHNISLAADAVFGGTTRWDLSGHTSTSTEPGLTGNGFNLAKVGGNQISWCCYNSAAAWNTDLGNLDDQLGILSIQCYVTLGRNTGTLIIRSNAAVEFCHNGTTVLDKPISMTNGCIQARYFSSSYPAYSVLSGPITLTGSNVFDVFTTTMTLIVDGQIGGSGMLNKGIGGHTEGGNVSTGVGTLILTASNSFTGDLRVQTGTLVLSNNASVTKAPGIVMAGGTLDASKRTDLTLTLASGQTLKGSGTVTGTVASPANTTVSPGVSSTAATLNVTGSVNLSGDTVMDITKTNTTKAADKLAVTGAIDLGGTLTVNFSGNTALAAGDRFTLFTATSYTHSFGATNLPSLPGGFAWSNSVVSGAWNIEVIATEPTARPVLTNSFSSSGLTLSWDTAYTSYLLEGETNTVSVGLTTNSADWHPVPGVSGNQVTVPVDPANGSAFFRLRK